MLCVWRAGLGQRKDVQAFPQAVLCPGLRPGTRQGTVTFKIELIKKTKQIVKQLVALHIYKNTGYGQGSICYLCLVISQSFVSCCESRS
jgi:hypothetical protein